MRGEQHSGRPEEWGDSYPGGPWEEVDRSGSLGGQDTGAYVGKRDVELDVA